MLSMQEAEQTRTSESDSPRASSSSNDLDTLSKAKLASYQDDPFTVTGPSVTKETELTQKIAKDV
jgi:hypothetical protein